jgi:hypothetical protein
VTDITDEQILERAHAIKSERGISLTDAMIAAEDELTPEAAIPTAFTVTIPVKARVAKWIGDEFGGHASFTIEERLGAYLTTVLSRSRVTALRYAEEGEDVTEGKAVTLRRDQFARKVPSK